jgi:hypothetical protein
MGGTIADRVNIPVKKVIIKAAPAIDLSVRLDEFKKDKKAAVGEVTSLLEKAYLDCIDEVNKTEND